MRVIGISKTRRRRSKHKQKSSKYIRALHNLLLFFLRSTDQTNRIDPRGTSSVNQTLKTHT